MRTVRVHSGNTGLDKQEYRHAGDPYSTECNLRNVACMGENSGEKTWRKETAVKT